MKRLTSGHGLGRLSNFARGQLAVRAFGAVPPPPPGPPTWLPQAHQVVQPQVKERNAGGDTTSFIPAPPPVSALPRQDASFPSAEVAAGASEKRPLSSQEKYQQMLQRLHLPLTKEPDTARPKPEDLIEGFRLRVKWSDGWWKAGVLETKDDQIKVHFDTWGGEHDEWISRDSQRLRLPLPDDRPAEEDDSKSFVSAHVRERAYVPKPFNPEKEFQKRQLRIREKIAAMQKTKIGFVDPQLAAKLGAQAGEAASTPGVTPVSLESAELESKKSKLKEEAHVSREVAALNVKAAEEVLAQAEAPLPPPLDTTLKPQEPDVPPPDVEAMEQEKVQPEPSRDPESPAREAQAPAKTEAANAVRWEELLSDKKERYYHEVATGRTQWELPSEGWVALLDDDGSKYYWNTEMGTTQWDPPL